MCTILGDYCLECWNGRNETIHGSDIATSREKKLESARIRIKELYRRKGELCEEKYKKIFDMPLKKRLLLGIQSTRLWVGLAEEVLKMNREMATKYNIVHWLQP